jgi:hypothetical protein
VKIYRVSFLFPQVDQPKFLYVFHLIKVKRENLRETHMRETNKVINDIYVMQILYNFGKFSWVRTNILRYELLVLNCDVCLSHIRGKERGSMQVLG